MMMWHKTHHYHSIHLLNYCHSTTLRLLLILVKEYHSMPEPALIAFSDSPLQQVVVLAKLQLREQVQLAPQPQVRRTIHQLEQAHQINHRLELHQIIHQ